MQHGNNLIECFIQPLQGSVVMSSHSAFMAVRKILCEYRWRSYTFHLHAEKNPSMGLKNGETGERNSISILLLVSNHCLMMLDRWQLTLSKTIVYFCQVISSQTPLLFRYEIPAESLKRSEDALHCMYETQLQPGSNLLGQIYKKKFNGDV